MNYCISSPAKQNLLHGHGRNIKTFVSVKAHVTDYRSPRICELALIAVHCLELNEWESNDQVIDLPRAAEKLVLCFDSSTNIQKHMEATNFISKDQIKESKKQCFDQATLDLLYGFLSRQEKPVCLIAHNGYLTDFPLLKAELDNLHKCIDAIDGESLLCADAAYIFKDMDRTDDDGVLSILDLMEYSFESLYRRYMKASLKADFGTAEDHAICLLQIIKKKFTVFLREFTCRHLSTVTAKPFKRSELSESPTKSMHGSTRAIRELFPACSSTEQPRNIIETETFVFLDLETTGLINASITEVCMIAIHQTNLTPYVIKQTGSYKLDDAIPRIHEKLQFLIRPRCLIDQISANISGICNEELERLNKQPFTYQTTTLIGSFLARQAKPICLVAHNGIKFDFKILKQHLKRCNVHRFDAGDLYCSDALVGLREVTKENKYSSYKLDEVYSHLCKNFSALSRNHHSAEEDTKMLIGVVRLDPNGLPTWLDHFKTQF